jgi:transcriptional regulator with XRE-family HTH domain
MQRGMLLPTDLRARRRALGLTQAGLAAELDVSANTVARWERAELQIGHPRRVLHRLEQLERDPARSRRPTAAPMTAGHLANHGSVLMILPHAVTRRSLFPTSSAVL